MTSGYGLGQVAVCCLHWAWAHHHHAHIHHTTRSAGERPTAQRDSGSGGRGGGCSEERGREVSKEDKVGRGREGAGRWRLVAPHDSRGNGKAHTHNQCPCQVVQKSANECVSLSVVALFFEPLWEPGAAGPNRAPDHCQQAPLKPPSVTRKAGPRSHVTQGRPMGGRITVD